MPRPFRGIITGRSSDAALIRADKSRFIARLFALVGPEEFYYRRLVWLAANGKKTSLVRLIAYLRRERPEVIAYARRRRESERPEILPHS